MDDAGALLQRDVLSEEYRRVAVVKRVPEGELFELAAPGSRDDATVEPEALEAARHEICSEQQVTALGVYKRVTQIRMNVECLICGDRPRRRGPDHGGDGVLGNRVQAENARELGTLCGAGQRKRHVDRDIFAILVFDLGFGERAVTIEAPVHRLQAAIEIAFFQKPAEDADFVGLVAIAHRRIVMVPVAEHAEALEIRHLQRDLLGRVRAAQPLRVCDRQVLAIGFFDLHLDRHAMAIPARHVGRVEAGELFALDDDILEDLVDRGANVDRTVRIRRPVVQNEARPAAARGADRLVHLAFLPIPDPAGLAPGEVAAHGKRRVGEIQRRLVVGLRVVGHRKPALISVLRSNRAPGRHRRESVA